MNKDKQGSNGKSSANNVDKYLQQLEKTDSTETLYYSQEQSFSPDELAKIINEQRLNELLALSDAFLHGLHEDIADFDDNLTTDITDNNKDSSK